MKQSVQQPATDRAVPAAAPRLRSSAALLYPLTAPAPATADALHFCRVAEGFYWLRIPMPIALDHINVYLLEDADTDSWWLVDTGMHLEATKTLWRAVHRHPLLRGRPIRRLVCTHHHYDHAGLAQWMNEEWGVELMMSRTEYLTMRATYAPFPAVTPPAFSRFCRSLGMEADMQDKVANALRQDPFVPQAAGSYTRLQAGQRLRIGGRSWYVLLGAGHCPEHVCLYCPDIAPPQEAPQPALLAGDQLIARISSNVSVSPSEPAANPLQDWIDSLHLLQHLPAATLVLPSHQNVFSGVRERAAELLEHHRLQLQYMCRFVAEHGTVSACAVLQALFPRLRKPIDVLLALGEVAAHLNWLQYQGIITAEATADAHGQSVLQYRLRAAVPQQLLMLADDRSQISQQRAWLLPLLAQAAAAEPVTQRQGLTGSD